MNKEHVAFWVSSMNFRNELDVSLTPGQFVLVIGPNNAGKSTLLRELRRSLSLNFGRGRILKDVSINRQGSRAAIFDWVDPQPAFKGGGARTEKVFVGGGGPIEDRDFESWLSPPIADRLLEQLHTYITYQSRMKAVEPCKSFDPLDGVPEYPFQSLLKRPEMEIRLNQLVEQAFGVSIVLDRAAGQEVVAYCVPRGEPAPSVNPVDLDYLRWLRHYPKLNFQGDGLKSYVGCLLELLAHTPLITIIDEPEVFLHPPQAKLLGRTLARERHLDQQMFVATHSADFLRGVLEAKSDSVRIIRLFQNATKGEAASISPARIAEIWSDPTLQYSNTLDALFHDAVVICEADADCRFYQWLSNEESGEQGRDIMFLPTGGKGRVPSVISAMRTLGVPCVAILDADAIREAQTLSALVAAAGGSWDELKPLWSSVNDASMKLGTAVTKEDLSRDFKALVSAHENRFITETLADRIRQLVRINSGWSLFKRSGLAALPSGAASKSAEDLLGRLRGLGIFVVPVGELEGFVRSVSGHGPSWVASVLEQYTPDSKELMAARKFVDQVLTRFAGSRTSSSGKVAAAAARKRSRPVSRFRELGRVLSEQVSRRAFWTFMVICIVVTATASGVSCGIAIGKSSRPEVDATQKPATCIPTTSAQIPPP